MLNEIFGLRVSNETSPCLPEPWGIPPIEVNFSCAAKSFSPEEVCRRAMKRNCELIASDQFTVVHNA
jgi:hypothetical protein